MRTIQLLEDMICW